MFDKVKHTLVCCVMWGCGVLVTGAVSLKIGMVNFYIV